MKQLGTPCVIYFKRAKLAPFHWGQGGVVQICPVKLYDCTIYACIYVYNFTYNLVSCLNMISSELMYLISINIYTIQISTM